MSWEDLSFSDVCRLVQAIEEASRGKPATIQAIIDRARPQPNLPNGDMTLRQARQLLTNKRQPEQHRHVATQTFAELVAACEFTSVERGFTEEHFPLVDDGVLTPNIRLLPFANQLGVDMLRETSGYALRRPVGVLSGLKFIAQHRQSIRQLREQIVFSNTSWQNRVPVLLRDGRLALFHLEGNFPGQWYWLVDT